MARNWNEIFLYNYRDYEFCNNLSEWLEAIEFIRNQYLQFEYKEEKYFRFKNVHQSNWKDKSNHAHVNKISKQEKEDMTLDSCNTLIVVKFHPKNVTY